MLLGLFLLIGLLLLLLLKFSVDFELNTSDLSMKPTISMGVGPPLRAAVPPASLLGKIGTLLRGAGRCEMCGMRWGGGQIRRFGLWIIFCKKWIFCTWKFGSAYMTRTGPLWAVVVFGPF